MTDLYITYGLRETLWVNKLVSMLESEGYTICWEHAVAPGDDVRTDESIQALNNAKCVLAIWSETAVDDHWVLSDANRAVDQANKLLSVVAKSAVIPDAFRRSETVFMQCWNKNKDDEHYKKLLAGIARFVTPSQPGEFEREQEKLARQARMRAENKQRAQTQKEREERAKLRRMSV